MKKLYALTFGKDYMGPEQVLAVLPGGFQKAMTKTQKDEKADDFPYAEMELEEEQAEELKRTYAESGFALTAAKGAKAPEKKK